MAALGASTLAYAQESGAYLGAALGQTKLKDWCDTAGGALAFSSCDEKDTGWKLQGGYRVNRFLGAEASYIDWGEVTASGTELAGGAPFEISADQRSYGLAVLGSFPFGASLDVFGKLGYLRTKQQTRNAARTVDRDTNEVHYGLGVRYALAPNWALRGEWENTRKVEVQLLSLGAEYRF